MPGPRSQAQPADRGLAANTATMERASIFSTAESSTSGDAVRLKMFRLSLIINQQST